MNVNLGYCPCLWEPLCGYEESTTTTTYYRAFQKLRCPSPRTFIPIVVNTPAFSGRALTLNFFVPSIKFASWDQGRSEGLQKSLAILTLARRHATPSKRKKTFLFQMRQDVRRYTLRDANLPIVIMPLTRKGAHRSSRWHADLGSRNFISFLINTITMRAIALHMIKWTVCSAPGEMFIWMRIL